jgi:hypothetical protein
MGFVRDITGSNAASASKDAGRMQAQASREAAEIQAKLSREAMAQQEAAANRALSINDIANNAGMDEIWKASTDARSWLDSSTNQSINQLRNSSQEAQANAAENTRLAQGYLDPLAQVAERGVEASNYLANPQAQYDSLVNNPLYQAALDNANRQSSSMAAAGGRINTGDTLEQLSNNVLLSASPLIDRQRQDSAMLLDQANNYYNTMAGMQQDYGNTSTNLISNLGNNTASLIGNRGSAIAQTYTNDGTNLARLRENQGITAANILTGNAAQQSNLLTQQGSQLANGLTGAANANAAGRVGAANARSQAYGSILGAGAQIAGSEAGAIVASSFFSDERLKKNISFNGKKGKHNWYTWNWNELAGEKLGLFGSSEGVIAQEVQQTNPEAVITKDGFLHVNYGAL